MSIDRAADAEALGADLTRRSSLSNTRTVQVIGRLLRNRSSQIGLVLLVGLLVVAATASLIAPFDPTAPDYTAVLHGPTSRHLFGTDNLGRDVLSRVIYGTRVSLRVGFIPVAAAFLVGTVVGMLSGFFGGWVDAVVMRLTDIGLAFPGILLALVVVAVLGPGLSNVMIALGIADVPLAIRVARGSALAAREQLYVQSAVAVGCRDRTILFRYIFPSVASSVLIVATLEVANAILIASGLSFLGLGAQPPAAEWGSMLAQAQSQIQVAWWAAVFPGVAIVVAVLGINLVGDGLRDALDPKTRG